ncbi:undecaprenyldiphospho-muramoylpentapeptide beta-N-acetylglucosaminyltransferase [Desulfosediminicola ganghwensis]|uniref:undecaprenyldiphospho-muramoylpentapeptide beta-N-acetylglucosaminyltransferase n=1 Tax=Desulfosediminicola ganghwensis TaxID=2569540 RepID=UPI0010AC0083|nr:undecaprenyldiphospho-muramoylpentapeptide beta-N-acetylglucosaminyltransferase [Desulfosediminicola ganghwensis]
MTPTKPIRMLITGGGTGGHLFPAVAAAQALTRREPESEVLFIGTRRKIDTTSLEKYGFASSSIYSYGLKGKTIPALLKALAVLPISFFQALSHIRRFKPDVALGVGGYVTGPVMLAARIAGVPTIVHEQNSVPGMANRKLGAIVEKVCISLPGSERFFPSEKVVFTGNPVRQDILALAGENKDTDEPKPFTLLVLGGSQGAQALNKLVTGAICSANNKAFGQFRVIHQTGARDCDWVQKSYEQAGVDAQVSAFFEDMKAVYEQADFLVSRSGATTLTELAVLGKPALLVPYPHAADDHQQKNAEHYAQGGGAFVCRESELTVESVRDTLKEMAGDVAKLAEMGKAMKRLGAPEAADKIVDVCLASVADADRTRGKGITEKINPGRVENVPKK